MATNMREKTARIAENKDRRPRAVAKHVRISPYKVRKDGKRVSKLKILYEDDELIVTTAYLVFLSLLTLDDDTLIILSSESVNL